MFVTLLLSVCVLFASKRSNLVAFGLTTPTVARRRLVHTTTTCVVVATAQAISNKPEASRAASYGLEDCIETVKAARETIGDTVANVEATNDAGPLRPTAKKLLNTGALRGCLAEAASRNTPAARHARDALEYIAMVVEFDAFDKLTKTYEPKRSQMYTPEKIAFSLKAFRAADRELLAFIFASASSNPRR